MSSNYCVYSPISSPATRHSCSDHHQSAPDFGSQPRESSAVRGTLPEVAAGNSTLPKHRSAESSILDDKIGLGAERTSPDQDSESDCIVKVDDADYEGIAAADEATLDEADAETFVPIHPISIVRQYFAKCDIRVKFDGSFVVASAATMANDHAEVSAFLARAELTSLDIVDELVLQCKAQGQKVKRSELQSAVRREVRRRQQERYAFVLGHVIVSDPAQAESEWSKLSNVIKLDKSLSVAILKHFVWQVKRKVLGKPVTHHLMPILFSSMQGTGKSTFAQRFLAPLEELASDPVTLSDFADARSGDIYRYPVVLIDDIDAVTDGQTAVLKSVMTSKKIRRRRLGTSMSMAYLQNATLFGTANQDITKLVDDDTGHRRFAMLPFRNGSIERGGDPSIWKIINEVDYLSLWRSVDPFEDTPIKPHLEALSEHQGIIRPNPLKEWLISLDIRSEALRRIQVQAGVQARDLFDLMCAQTEIEISEAEFGKRLRHLLKDPASPFDRKDRKANGYYYHLRKPE